MEGITTILFDVDGTILDTREFILKATEHALSTLGKPIPERSFISKHVGKPFSDYYFSVSGSREHLDELVELHRGFQMDNLNLAKLFPETLQILTVLKQKGYKLGAVTTRSKKTSLKTLASCGVLELFDTVISGEDAKEIKPHPGPLLKALENLNELPQNAIMIGDSHFDIEAGKNAGTKTIRVTYGFHNDNLHAPEPDFFIDDIADILKLL